MIEAKFWEDWTN